MRHFYYQRPREKLQEKGVRSLSDTELLQVIIGSGNSKVSGARIAKRVAELLAGGPPPTFAQLVIEPGVGSAKAAQILAALELGTRAHKGDLSVKRLVPVFESLKTSKKRMIEYCLLDGARTTLLHEKVAIPDHLSADKEVKKLFASGLRVHASSIEVGIGQQDEDIATLDVKLMSVMGLLFETATLLEMKLTTIWLVNKDSQKPFKRKSLI